MNRLDIAMFAWERLLFQPYLWGGDDPMRGYDCSGLVLEGLKSCGKFGREGDTTAAGLAKLFIPTKVIKPGCLLFWGNPVTHVEVVWRVEPDGTVYTIAAAGGGSKTLSVEEAVKHNAYVKIRPARPEWHSPVDPFVEER